MRSVVFLALSLVALGCGKKPDPQPDLGNVQIAPDPAPAGPPAPPAERKWPRKPVDPNNFAGKSLAQWREELRSNDPARQRTAIRAVEAIGPPAAEAVPDLVAAGVALAMKDSLGGHARAIEEIGKPAVPHLIAAFPKSDEVVKPDDFNSPLRILRNHVLAGLTALGPDAAEARPMLEGLVKHPDPAVRSQALFTLAALGPAAKPAIPVFLEALKSPDEETRITAAATLGSLDPEATADAALPVLLAVPHRTGTNPHPHHRVSEILPRFGTKAVGALLARASKPDRKEADGALVRLTSFKREQLAPFAPELLKLLQETQSSYVLSVLSKVGPEAKAALPEVLKLARERLHRTYAIWTASALGATPDELFPVVKEMLDRPSPDQNEVELITYLGPRKKEFLPALDALLADPRDAVKLAAASVLVGIDPTSAKACGVILEMTKSGDSIVIHNATLKLKNLPAASAAGLKPHLTHAKADLRLLAAARIVARDPSDPQAVKLLKDNFYREEPSLNPGAPVFPIVSWEALGAFQEARTGGAPHLAELLKHPKPHARAAAARALSRMGVDGAPVVADIATAIPKADDATRLWLYSALGRIGADATPRVELLREGLKSPDPRIRFVAAESLAALAPTDPTPASVLVGLLDPKTLADDRVRQFQPLPGIGQAEPRTAPRGREPQDFRSAVIELLYDIDPEAAIRAGVFQVPHPSHARR